jgi:DNA mismatch repair protein MutL
VESRPVSQAFAPIVDSKIEEKAEQIKLTDSIVDSKKIDEQLPKQNLQSLSVDTAPTPILAPQKEENSVEISNLPISKVLDSYISYLESDKNSYDIVSHNNLPKDEQQINNESPKLVDESPISVSSLNYRIVGEVFNSYLIVEKDDKMLIIDKHAAHERIIFEKNKEMMTKKEPSSQILISPIEIMLTSAEITVVNDYLTEFLKLGFNIQAKKYSVLISSIPTELASCDVQDTISTMINRIKDGQGNARLTRDILFEKALYQASCKAAIKAGREYVDAHTEWIVEQLMKIPDITFCPHGRPVAMELSKRNLDNQFERT